MTIEVRMPQMGESLAEGTLVKWHKKVGDRVRRDEPLFEISTDKVDTEITAPHDGIITELLADEDSVVTVGAPLAVIHPADPPDPEATSATPSPDPPATNNTDPVSDDSLGDRGQDPGVRRVLPG